MKKIMLGLLVLTLSTHIIASESNDQNSRTEAMKAQGEHEASLFAVTKAKSNAKKNLKQKCQRELNGKIIGEISYKLLSYDGSDMIAHVEAEAICKY